MLRVSLASLRLSNLPVTQRQVAEAGGTNHANEDLGVARRPAKRISPPLRARLAGTESMTLELESVDRQQGPGLPPAHDYTRSRTSLRNRGGLLVAGETGDADTHPDPCHRLPRRPRRNDRDNLSVWVPDRDGNQ